MKRVKFKDGICAGLRMERTDPPELLSQLKKRLHNLHWPATEGLYQDLINICGEPLKIEWDHQIKMPAEDAAYIKLKYGNIVEYIKD